jgi:hypothetical protein
MADPTFEAERFAEIMARVNEEMRLYGEVSPGTTDAMMKAKHGINNFTAGTAKAADVVGHLAGAATSAGKAMLDGKKGAAAFNESVDSMASAAQAAGAALALMIPGGIAIKLLIAGVTAAATAYAKYTQAANDMADKLSKGYQGLAKSGAAAADGMTGLYRDAKKLGLSMNELDQMVSLVAENAKDFALFAGSVSEGRKRFADLSESMKPARTGLMNLGMGMEEINAASAGYLRLQSRIGQTQNKTTAELADSTRRYLYEQDALTKLTGQTRKEQEAAREEIRSQERFAAVLQQMRAKGQISEAKALEDSYLILRSQSKEAAQGFADISTGNLQTEAAQKSMLATQGGSMEASQRIQAGQLSAAQGAQQVAEAYGRTAEQLGSLGIVGQFDKTFGSLSDAIKLGAFAQGDINAQYNKILEDQKKQAAGQDALVANQTKLVQTQMEANKAMEAFIKEGIVPAQKQMIALAEASRSAAETLSGVAGGKSTKGGTATAALAGAGAGALTGAAIGSIVPVIGTAVGGAVGAVLGGLGGALFANRNAPAQGTAGAASSAEDYQRNIPMAAEGGFLKGPVDGYLAMLHGNELVIPEDKLKGKISAPGAASGLIAKEQAQIDLFTKDILKDTELLAKLTDSDAKRTQDYSRTQKKLIELKVKLMGEEIDILEEQNKAIEEMANVFERSGGQGGAAGFKKMMRMQNLGMGGGSAMGGGMAANQVKSGGSAMGGGMAANQVKSGTGIGITTGSGLPLTTQPPAGASIPEGQGTGSAKTNIDNLLAFGDRSGSKANFEALDDAFQNAVTKAAEEYNSVTGKKIKINSATRDPADQERIYAESVAAGRPGISPTGMPIGKPGTSRHERGLAIDIQNYNDPQAVAAFNRQGLFQKVPNDPVHFQFEEGGVASGPRSGYGATLHGDEAVIPLNNGAGN